MKDIRMPSSYGKYCFTIKQACLMRVSDSFELNMLHKVIFIYSLPELIHLLFKSVVMSFNYGVKKVAISITSVDSK